jgi:hypothetical protein
MSMTRIETVVIGGGQAGLSVSYYLTGKAESTSSSSKRMRPPMRGVTIAGIRSR